MDSVRPKVLLLCIFFVVPTTSWATPPPVIHTDPIVLEAVDEGDEDATSQIAHEIGGSPLMVDITDADAPRRIQETLRRVGVACVVLFSLGAIFCPYDHSSARLC